MLVLRFAFLLFVMGATTLTLAMFNRAPRRWGPYYFVPNKQVNPIQNRFELNAWQANKRKKLWHVYYDNRGVILKMILKDGDKELRKVDFYHNRWGQLRMKRNTEGWMVEETWFKEQADAKQADD